MMLLHRTLGDSPHTDVNEIVFFLQAQHIFVLCCTLVVS